MGVKLFVSFWPGSCWKKQRVKISSWSALILLHKTLSLAFA